MSDPRGSVYLFANIQICIIHAKSRDSLWPRPLWPRPHGRINTTLVYRRWTMILRWRHSNSFLGSRTQSLAAIECISMCLNESVEQRHILLRTVILFWRLSCPLLMQFMHANRKCTWTENRLYTGYARAVRSYRISWRVVANAVKLLHRCRVV